MRNEAAWTTFEGRLSWAIQSAQVSRSQIAQALGTAKPRLSEWASGRKRPSLEFLVQLPLVLGVDGHWLLTGQTHAAVEGPLSERTRLGVEEEKNREPSPAWVHDLRAGLLEDLRTELAAQYSELPSRPPPVSAEPKSPDPDPDVSPIQSAPGWHDEDYESVRHYESEDVRLAAGTGTFADQEPVAGEVKFRTSWLRKRRLRAKDLFLVDVSGDSMEPAICDGDAALVDETHTSPRSGKIYALRTGDGPLVKRLRKRDHRWWADSDNDKHEPQPLDDRARIMGRVVWWAHTD